MDWPWKYVQAEGGFQDWAAEVLENVVSVKFRMCSNVSEDLLLKELC